MIARTKGMIVRREHLTGIWTPDVMIPDRYVFVVRFYDPRTQRFEEDAIACSRAIFERFAAGDWVRLRVNTRIWRPLQHWVIDK